MAHAITLLGGLGISGEGRASGRLQTRKAGGLLAYLAYFRNRAHPRDALVELFWPEANLDAGRQNLRQALFSLRRQWDTPGVPVILADRSSVQINGALVTTDVGLFREALRKATKAPGPVDRRRHFLEAFDLYQGELLPGLEDDWVYAERATLADELIAGVRRLTTLLEEADEPDAAIGPLRKAITADPYREETNYDFLRVLQLCGRSEEALRHFQGFQRRLREEFGTVPSARTRELLLRRPETHRNRPGSGSARTGTTLAPPVEGPRQQPASLECLCGTVTILALYGDSGEAVMEAYGGSVLLHGGVGIMRSGPVLLSGFPGATGACAAALDCRRSTGPTSEGFKAALHTAEVSEPLQSAGGAVLSEASAMLESAHAGQLLCSGATAALLQNAGAQVSLRSLGEYRLRRSGGSLHVYQVGHEEDPERRFPPLNADRADGAVLPHALDRFFGREAERERVSALLLETATRLLVLTGPGGSGKTRISVELARELGHRFGGAVWFIPLADVSEPGAMPEAILAALPINRAANTDPLPQVLEFLRSRTCLLVLDNLEQLQGRETGDASAEALIRTIVEKCPALTCLVTSRRRLRLPGEREIPIAPLPTPQLSEDLDADPGRLASIASVQLFIDRAQAVRPDFQMTPRNAAAISRLCRELEGIPLAIELAAARASVCSPGQMLKELRSRFRFLATRRRTVVERHRTVWAALEWSYRLLTPASQQFFAGLSVFRGGWTIEGAAAVGEEPQSLDLLEDLREASLVRTEENAGVELRFRTLETMREFGWEKLRPERQGELRRRHAEFHLRAAREAYHHRLSKTDARPLESLAADYENFRLALEDFGGREPETALELATYLSWFWEGTGRVTEALFCLRRTLDSAEAASDEAKARALSAIGRLHFWQGDFPKAKGVLLQSQLLAERIEDRSILADVLTQLGMVSVYIAEYESARASLEQALALYRAAADDGGQAQTLLQLGILGSSTSNWALSRASLTDCVVSARRAGDQRSLGLALFFVGDAALCVYDLEAAEKPLQESRAVGEASQDETVLSHALWNLAMLYIERRELETAVGLLARVVVYARALGGWTHPFVLEGYGYLVAASGDFSEAASLLATSAVVRHASSMPLTSSYLPRHERYLALIRSGLSEREFELASQEGRLTAPEIAIERVFQKCRRGTPAVPPPV
jgi:predicted ATPase/DNA-binding SARP family transcriptional activator